APPCAQPRYRAPATARAVGAGGAVSENAETWSVLPAPPVPAAFARRLARGVAEVPDPGSGARQHHHPSEENR
ncbi:hypothetical protein WEI85_27290, partial [Actinomycetes bacterium KLBMP 9797]